MHIYSFYIIIVTSNLTEAGVMHEAGYVDYLEHLVPLPILDINILSMIRNSQLRLVEGPCHYVARHSDFLATDLKALLVR